MQHPGIPDFTPKPENETLIDALDRWSEANWAKVPELIRRDCEEHLRASVMADAPELLEKWRDQRRRGISIGSDDPRFHLGTGMVVRYCLRDQLHDSELPNVELDHKGEPYGQHESGLGNWDDFYFGVLAAIAA